MVEDYSSSGDHILLSFWADRLYIESPPPWVLDHADHNESFPSVRIVKAHNCGLFKARRYSHIAAPSLVAGLDTLWIGQIYHPHIKEHQKGLKPPIGGTIPYTFRDLRCHVLFTPLYALRTANGRRVAWQMGDMPLFEKCVWLDDKAFPL
jgi:hypothetical protein